MEAINLKSQFPGVLLQCLWLTEPDKFPSKEVQEKSYFGVISSTHALQVESQIGVPMVCNREKPPGPVVNKFG